MSTTDELLEEMLEDVEEYATPVTDDDLQFWIDEHLRVISIPKNGVVAGVEGDKNVNKIKFGMNRYYHGFDMSTFSGRILYSNAKGNKNYYNIADMQTSGNTITFSWLVDADAVQYMGKTAFVVYLFKTKGSELRQKFYSTLATLKVLEGMEVDSAVPIEKQTDIIERMKEEISAYAEEVKKSLPADYTAMTEQVNSLKEDLGNYDSKLRSFKDVNATEIVSGKLFNLKDKNEHDKENSCYIKQIIPGFIHKIKVSGKSAAAKYDFDLGGFYNNDGILISKFGNDNDTVYTDLELDVPNGTSFIYVNQNEVPSATYKKVKFLDVIDAVQNEEQTNQSLIDLREEALNNSKRIEECQKVITSVNIHPQFDIVGYAVRNPDNDSLFFNSENGYRTDYIDITNYKYIDATLYGNEYIWKVAFFDKDKKFLPSISIQGDDNVNELKNIEIPNDAVYVVLSTYSPAENNGEANIYNSNSIELKYDSKIADLKSRVTDVKNTVAELENKEHLFDNTEFALFHTFGVIGDSLSVGHTVSEDGHLTEGRNIYYSWGQYLARRLGNYCLNFGRSGVTSKLWMSPSEQYCYPRLVDPNNLCQAYIIALGAMMRQ